MLIALPLAQAASPLAELRWVQSHDGQTPSAQGQDPLSLLPADGSLTLVVPAPLLSWHWVSLPAAPASRLRQVLEGLLEDQLLADPTSLHFALAPGLGPRGSGWVAACDKAWLQSWLALLHSAGRRIVRILPEASPQSTPWQGAIHTLGGAWWLQASAQGLLCLPLSHSDEPTSANPPWPLWSEVPVLAEPALVQLVQRLGAQTVSLTSPGQRLLAQAASGWDLAQFELRTAGALRHSQRLLAAVRSLALAPAWRGFRYGLLAAATLGSVGLAASAWHSQQQLQQLQHAQRQLLTQTFPHITLILDAPLQLSRELQRLQRQTGGAGPSLLEQFLMDFSASAPSGVALSALLFENDTLRLTLADGPAQARDATLQALSQRGWRLQAADPSSPLSYSASRALLAPAAAAPTPAPRP